MFGYQACHVCAQLEHVFSVTCPRLDENDGILKVKRVVSEILTAASVLYIQVL